MRNDLSLVITAHRMRYLTEGLLSVGAQAYKNFETIVCIDTKPNAVDIGYVTEIFESLQLQGEVVQVQGNGTAGMVRNYGFAASKGEWIAYLDGDDMLHPSAMGEMQKAIDSFGRDYDIFSSGMIRILLNGSIKPLKESLTFLPSTRIYKVDPEQEKVPTFFNQFQCIRRNEWEKYKYDETTNGEDIDYMLHHLLMSRFRKIPLYLYYYRNVGASFSKKKMCDITSKRYDDLYYENLFNSLFTSAYKGNFEEYSDA